MRDYFHLLTPLSLDEFLIYTHAKGLPPILWGMLLRDDDLKGLPLTLGAYSNIVKDQPYTKGKFCGWMIEGCEDDL